MNKKNSHLKDFKVNIRISLAFLWTAIMLLYIYADFFNLMTPDSIQGMMDLQTPLGPTTPGILVGFSILLIIPALLIPASIILKPILAKWLNIIFGVFYGAISILIFIADFNSSWMTFFVL